jgi:hypothetical protein
VSVNIFFGVTVGITLETKSVAVCVQRVCIRRPTGFTWQVPYELAVRLDRIHLLGLGGTASSLQ